MKNELIDNIAKIHTTDMGLVRISRNLGITEDPVEYCINLILSPLALTERKGKNWYVTEGNITLTVNAHSYTIITAHRVK